MCVSVLFMSPLCFVFLLVTYIPAIFERDLFISHLVFKLNSVNSLSIISCCLSVPIHSLSFRRIIKKWTIPGLFFVYFCLFKQTITFSQQINVKKCPSSIWPWDSNPQPLEHESPPITTRPGLPPVQRIIISSWIFLLFRSFRYRLFLSNECRRFVIVSHKKCSQSPMWPDWTIFQKVIGVKLFTQ